MPPADEEKGVTPTLTQALRSGEHSLKLVRPAEISCVSHDEASVERLFLPQRILVMCNREKSFIVAPVRDDMHAIHRRPA
jgi:hypothetical protein